MQNTGILTWLYLCIYLIHRYVIDNVILVSVETK